MTWQQIFEDALQVVRGCETGFFDAKFHKFGVFWRPFASKKLFGFFSLIFGFFGGSSHILSDWCLGFLKILLKSVTSLS